jgi:hypothetical protein
VAERLTSRTIFKDRQRPFVEVTGDPWEYVTKENHDVNLVAFNGVVNLVPDLVKNFHIGDLRALRAGQPFTKGGRSMRLHLYAPGDKPQGGTIWLKRDGQSVTIKDVKPFLERRPANLVETLNLVRRELADLGMEPEGQKYYKVTSIPVESLPIDSIPETSYEICKPISFYTMFGHTDQPVYYRDENAAYLARLAQYFPSLRRLYDYRQQVSEPTQIVLKHLATTLHGKLIHKRPDLYYNIVKDVRDSMDSYMSPTTIRAQTDGYLDLNDSDIPHSAELGGLKKRVLSGITIGSTSLWWTPEGVRKHQGLRGTELSESDYLRHLRDYPFEPLVVKRRIFDWETFQYVTEPFTIAQRHAFETCRACQAGLPGPDRALHDVVRSVESAYYD